MAAKNKNMEKDIEQESAVQEQVEEVSCNCSPDYAELETQLQEAVGKVSALEADKKNLIEQYEILAKKYERLFNLYANNLDYYLVGSYIKEGQK